MDLGPLKQNSSCGGEKRIVMGEEDLQITKISSVFKVSSRVPLSANSPTFYTHRAAHA